MSDEIRIKAGDGENNAYISGGYINMIIGDTPIEIHYNDRTYLLENTRSGKLIMTKDHKDESIK